MAHGWARQLVVTVAVEADDPAVVGRTGSYRSLGGLERFHGLCRRYGVPPTYLLTWSAACEPRCVECLRAWAAEAEIGAHLHPEEVPPIAEAERGCTTLRPRDVEPERLREKVGNLVARVAEATGQRPTSYRAGFLDLTPPQVAALAELGIEADSSLGPFEKTREGYPYLRAPLAPYLLSPDNVCRPRMDCRLPIRLRESDEAASAEALADCRLEEGDARTEQSEIGNRKSEMPPVVEVPVTSVFRRPFPRALCGAYFGAPGPVRGVLRRMGLAELLRFRPATASGAELVAVCERTERLGVPAVMSIHSNELAAGTSGGVRTEAESEAYFGRLEHLFGYARQNGWASRTLTAVARDVRGGKEVA